MKKILCFLLAFMMVLPLSYTFAIAEEPLTSPQDDASTTDLAVNAKAAYLMEYSSGKVVYAKQEHEKLYPASMTKMMGLLLIYEALNSGKLSWEDIITTSEHAASMGGSQVFLEVNEQISVKDIVKSICIASANDAMVAIAEKLGGTHEGFVKKMNEKAKELELTNTHFMNATGLHDPEHYSTAHDMGMIAQALIKEGKDDLLEITATYDAYIRENTDNKFWLVNTNKLLKQYPGVDGLKTGFTQEAMSCITVTAKKDNLRLIAVVMGEPSSKQRNAEIKTMLDYGFTQFEQGLLYPQGTILETITMDYAKPNTIELINLEDVTNVFEKGSEPKEKNKSIELLKTELPLLPGEVVGKVTIEMDDGTIIEANLGVKEEIYPLAYFDVFIKSMKDFLI